MHTSDERLCLLTDSPRSAIRWRLKDYEQILRAEINLMIASEGPRLRRLDHGRLDGHAGARR